MRLALLCTILLASCDDPIDAESTDPVDLGRGEWAPNGEVTTTAYADGVLYLGGNFTEVGPITGAFAGVDIATGKPLLGRARITGLVFAVTSDGAGGWYLGGHLWQADGEFRGNVVHIDVDGEVDPAFRPEHIGPVSSLAVVDGRLIVGGHWFQTSDFGTSLLVLDATTGAKTPWTPQVSGWVHSLVVHDHTLYVGGAFSSIDGQPRGGLGAFDLRTNQLVPWAPEVDEVSRMVPRGLYEHDDVLYVGMQSGLKAYDATTGELTSWSPRIVGQAKVIAVADNTVYLGGEFSSVEGHFRNSLAAVDATTAKVLPWNPGPTGGVEAAVVRGNTIYVAGWFTKVHGVWRNHLAAIDTTTGAVTDWDPGMRNYVPTCWDIGDICSTPASGRATTLALAGNTVFVAGDFTGFGGIARGGLAAIDVKTGEPTEWAPYANGNVRVLAALDGEVYLGGDFGTINDQPRTRLAAVDGVTGALASWNPNANGSVRTIVPRADHVFVGGEFTQIGGHARRHLARLDAAGSTTSWTADADGAVYTLVLDENTLYAGGAFATIGGQPRGRLAALDPTSGAVAAWDPQIDGEVRALAVERGVVFAGGAFTRAGNARRSNLAAFGPNSGLATAWNPGSDGAIDTMVAMDGLVYVGGSYVLIGGAYPRPTFAAFDMAGIAMSHVGVGAYGYTVAHLGPPEPSVRTLTKGARTVYAGGTFTASTYELQPFITGFSKRP